MPHSAVATLSAFSSPPNGLNHELPTINHKRCGAPRHTHKMPGMAKAKIYLYRNCGTCRKALKWLAEHDVEFTEIAVREQPPSAVEIKRVIKALGGEVRKVFNTSSKDYRDGGFKERLGDMGIDEVVAALQANGNLVKRPFVVTGSSGLVGFRPDEWDAFFA